MSNDNVKFYQRKVFWATVVFVLLLVVGAAIALTQGSEGVIWAPGPIDSTPVPSVHKA